MSKEDWPSQNFRDKAISRLESEFKLNAKNMEILPMLGEQVQGRVHSCGERSDDFHRYRQGIPKNRRFE
jgi:hypothetical protein